MAETAADRLYWPDEYFDECMPDGRSSPDAWLFRLDDGAHRYGETNDEVWPSVALAEGDVVAFTYREHVRTHVLRFAPDGSVSFPTGTPTGNWFWMQHDSDVSGDTLDELIRSIRECCLAEGDVSVGACRWSTEDCRQRFTALDGPPRFVPADPAP